MRSACFVVDGFDSMITLLIVINLLGGGRETRELDVADAVEMQAAVDDACAAGTAEWWIIDAEGYASRPY